MAAVRVHAGIAIEPDQDLRRLEGRRHHATRPPERMSGFLRLLAAIACGVALVTVATTRPAAQAQSWLLVGSLNQPHSYHTATLLLDGRVLVAGNTTSPGVSPTSAELYDPIAKAWTPTASMNVARCAMAAVRLYDGRVLVSGGRCGPGGGFSTNTAEIYDPGTAAWTLTPNMIRDRTNHTATLLSDHRVLVTGGYSDGGGGFLAAAEIYDPIFNTWTSVPNMGTGRWQHTATLLNDGRVLIAAGENYAFCNTSCGINSAEIYDPATGATGAWSVSGNLNFARMGHGAALLPNGKVLVAAGLNYSNSVSASSLTSAELFDPTVGPGVWTATGSLHEARHSFVSVSLPDGKLLVAGGGKYTGGVGPVVTNGVETYDPSSGAWTQLASLNQARYTSAGTLLTDGTVLVAGGYDGAQALPSAEILTSDATAPTTTASPSPSPNGNGWNNGNVTLTLNAVDAGTGVQSITYSLTGAQSGGATVAGSSTAFTIVNEGITTVTYHARDNGGNVEADKTHVVRIDRTPPLLGGLPNNIVTGATSGAGAVVNFALGPVMPSDALSGVAAVTITPLASGATFPVGTTHETVTAVDLAGNTATGGFDVTVNRALLSIAVSPPMAAITTSPGSQQFQATGTFSDGSAQLLSAGGGTWTAAGALATPRFYHSSTRLQDGSVLVVGGYDFSATFASAERYYPATGTWVSAGTMATQRLSHTATLLPNGKVLVAGGIRYVGSSGFLTNTTEIYDPVANSWSPGAPLTLGVRSSHSAVLLGTGKVLVTAGLQSYPDCTYRATAELYDPASNSWAATGSLHLARSSATTTLLANGKVLLASGPANNCPTPNNGLNEAELYDPATGTWTVTGNLSVPRYNNTITRLPNGKVLLAGGVSGGTLASADLYDPATGTFSLTGSLGVARTTSGGTGDNGDSPLLQNGKVLVAAGSTLSGTILGSAELYDPASGTWTPTGSLATARAFNTATLLQDGRVLVVGGLGIGSTSLGTAEIYVPAADVSWASSNPGVATINQTGLATGVGTGTTTITATSGSISGSATLTVDTVAPTTTAMPSPAANGAGWTNSQVTVALHAIDNAGGSGVQSITYSLNGQQNAGPTTVPGDTASVALSVDGTTTVKYYATDRNGNVEAEHALSIMIDRGAPLLSYPFQIQTNAMSSAGATVTFSVSASDGLSGLAGPVSVLPFGSGATFPIGTTHETVTATDVAGNVATATFDVIVSPTRPNINVFGGTFTADGNPHPATATATDQGNNPVTGSFTFTYLPGGAAPVNPGRFSATASFTSADPAFLSVPSAWTTKASDPNAKHSPAVASINGNLYVQGFDQDAGGSPVAPRLGIYNTFSNTWTTGAPPSLIRAYASAAAINGKMYVVGGCISSDCRIGVAGAAALEIYDPSTNTWTTGAPMPRARLGAASAVINNKLYVAGGTTDCPPCGPSTALDIYDPVTNSWASGAPMPTSRELAMGAAADGRLYVIGGYERGSVNASVATVSIYDPVSNSWSGGEPMPTPRTGAAVGVVNGEIYVIGGVGSTTALNVSESYSPSANAWVPRLSMPTARTNVSAGVVNSTIYVIDGNAGGARLTTNEAYDGSLSNTITINPADTTPPTTSASYQGPNANGWNRFNVSVNLNAFDSGGAASPSGVQSITYALTGAQTGGATVGCCGASFTISNEGTTTVTYHATDNRGNVEADHTLIIKLDKTSPSAASLSNITVNATSSIGAVVNFDLLASDGLSGIDTVTLTRGLPSGSTFPHGITNESFTITDKAGNNTFRSFSVTVNKTLLSIAVSPSTATIRVGQGQGFQATGHFTSGPDQTLPTTSGGGGGGGGGFSGQAWQIQFPLPTPLNISACTAGSAGFTSQPFSPMVGAVHTSWGNPTPLVQVDGTVTTTEVHLTLSCIPANGATGAIDATWSNSASRYVGTQSFNGSTGPVTITGWSTKAPLPTARFAFGAASVNGMVYAMGGGDPSQPQPVDAYDPATNSWSTVAQMATSREGAAVAALNGKIYVAGGHVSGGVASGVFQAFDPATNTWNAVPLPAMPTARAHLALVAAGGKLYAIGGDTLSSNGGLTAVVERYDPASGLWSSMAPMASPRNFLAAGALNSDATIVAAGGSGSAVELYDVAANSWAAGPTMLSSGGTSGAVVVNNALFVFGVGGTGVQMFRPVGTQPTGWAVLASMPTARGQFGVAAIGDVVYAIGGQLSGGSTTTAAVEAFSTPKPGDFSVSSGGGGGGGGGTSLPTVSWQSTATSVASISSGGFANGNAAGQTTIVATAAGVSCATTNTCATLTVTEPGRLTLTLAPGSAPFGSVAVSVINPSTGSVVNGPFEVLIGEAQTINNENPFRLRFTAPAGYTVTPVTVDLIVRSGDNIVVPLFFAAIDTTPPAIDPHATVTAEATGAGGAVVRYAPPATHDAVDGPGVASCSPASGSPFLLGTTQVSCVATDAAGNTANSFFDVFVADTTPPVVNCGSPDGVWHGGDVSLACTATDSVGLLNAADASFSLSTAVAAGTETATAATGSRAVCDQHGNCATAGPIGPIMVDRKGPSLTVSPNRVAEAGAAGVATVSFAAATATDGGSGVASVSCDRASGDTFSIGVTTVHCSAADNSGNPATATFTVTVQDTMPPVVTVPANITTDATSVGGATVAYAATALDVVDGVRPVACTPASGSTFPVGTTIVTCSSADTRGNAATRTFTVTVRSASDIVTLLLGDIADFQQARNLLQNVMTSINAGNVSSACGQLSAFISQVQAQAGKKLTQAEAAALIVSATDARAALGCQ